MVIFLWEFRVKEGREREFERIYGPEGDWASLFRRGKGYLGTEVWVDAGDPGRYLTVDRWASRETCEEFRREWNSEYRALDQRCANLTEREASLGSFQLPGGGPG